MKKNENETKSYIVGFENGKKQVLEQVLKFVEKESKFIFSKCEDMLLDRLVKEIKKMGEVK